MAPRSTRYLVDEKGRKKAVLLGIGEYSRLLRRLEYLEDALELEEAVKSTSEFKDYSEVRDELVHEGKL